MFPNLSALLATVFGGKGSKEVTLKVNSEGLQSEDTASLEAAETKAAEMEAESARLKADSEEKDKKIVSLEATVSDQKNQITSLEKEKATLTSEKAELQEKADAKLAGAATTVISKDDASGESKHRSQADDESDKYVGLAAGIDFSTANKTQK